MPTNRTRWRNNGGGRRNGEREQTQLATEIIKVPDLGDAGDVEVIEIPVAVGQKVAENDSLLVLESDKAAMEIPAPIAGVIESIAVNLGDQVAAGAEILTLGTAELAAAEPAEDVVEEAEPGPARAQPGDGVEHPEAAAESEPAKDGQARVGASTGGESAPSGIAAQPASAPPTAAAPQPAAAESVLKPKPTASANVYAGPAVRKLARELGVDLTLLEGSGARGRIVKEDVHEFVKSSINRPAAAAISSGAPDIDFSLFGEIEQIPRSKLAKVTAANMRRSWLAVPHVAQFEEADVTELEQFRAGLKAEAESRGVKLTPLPFLLKACAQTLREFPQFNVSIHSSGEYVIQKKYTHIGVAVATEAGLVVPVVRDVDQKNLWQLAQEVAAASVKARERKLTPDDMQGACFTISSLGAIGGTGFVPIVNAPEVAILGVARAAVKPVWRDGEFVPRTMLPLTLTYDHQAVNGVDGGRFAAHLAALLGDIRRLLL